MVPVATSTRPTLRQILAATGRVQIEIECGCIGWLRQEGTSGGTQPVVSVRITAPCPAGHPHHPGAGVTERFLPEQVTALRQVDAR